MEATMMHPNAARMMEIIQAFNEGRHEVIGAVHPRRRPARVRRRFDQIHVNAWRFVDGKASEGWFLPDDQDEWDRYLTARGS